MQKEQNNREIHSTDRLRKNEKKKRKTKKGKLKVLLMKLLNDCENLRKGETEKKERRAKINTK